MVSQHQPLCVGSQFPDQGLNPCSLHCKGLSTVFFNTIVQKAPTLWHSAFFTVQLSHPYMTTGKTIALTRRTFVGKVMSLLFNMLSQFVIVFLSSSKRLLIPWMQPSSSVIKRCLPFGSKAMTKLDSILKSRHIPLPTKVHTVKLWFFQQSCTDVCELAHKEG